MRKDGIYVNDLLPKYPGGDLRHKRLSVTGGTSSIPVGTVITAMMDLEDETLPNNPTALNKQNLLQDNTGALCGGAATPNEALYNIAIKPTQTRILAADENIEYASLVESVNKFTAVNVPSPYSSFTSGAQIIFNGELYVAAGGGTSGSYLTVRKAANAQLDFINVTLSAQPPASIAQCQFGTRRVTGSDELWLFALSGSLPSRNIEVYKYSSNTFTKIAYTDAFEAYPGSGNYRSILTVDMQSQALRLYIGTAAAIKSYYYESSTNKFRSIGNDITSGLAGNIGCMAFAGYMNDYYLAAGADAANNFINVLKFNPSTNNFTTLTALTPMITDLDKGNPAIAYDIDLCVYNNKMFVSVAHSQFPSLSNFVYDGVNFTYKIFTASSPPTNAAGNTCSFYADTGKLLLAAGANNSDIYYYEWDDANNYFKQSYFSVADSVQVIYCKLVNYKNYAFAVFINNGNHLYINRGFYARLIRNMSSVISWGKARNKALSGESVRVDLFTL